MLLRYSFVLWSPSIVREVIDSWTQDKDILEFAKVKPNVV